MKSQYKPPIHKLKLFLILTISIAASSFDLKAQGYTYRSRNFEKAGVNEYIGIFWGNYVSYWTSQNKKTIQLEIQAFKFDGITEYIVHFPNDKQTTYQLLPKGDQLLCVHPDGKKQWFERLPSVWRSQDFEQAGIVEYLESSSEESFFYYTNQEKEQKIKLEVIGPPHEYPYKVKFPGGKAIYTFDFEPICFGSIICIHPDGKKQVFQYYQWDKELK